MKAAALRVFQPSETVNEHAWKPSLYNHFVEKGDTVWGVNFFSTALIRLDREQYRAVREILDTPPQPADMEPHQALRRALIKGKFLVPVKFDEIEFLKQKNRASRFGNHSLSLIIAPTLRCNFACEYCYVDLNANKMKPEDRNKVARFFDKKLPEATSGHVVWTGGDPSLAMDVVEELSLQFIKSCERKGCTYNAYLITNGYLLDDKMREHMRNSKILAIQVSLDGSREFHDSVRFLANKKPTYDVVLKNIEDTCDEFKVNIRINVNKDNYRNIADLLDDIENRDLTQKLTIYFAHVDDVNDNSASYHQTCLPSREYANIEASLTRLALSKGFTLGDRALPRRPVKTFCGANTTNFYVIDSSANLLKCYHDFGAADKHGIGKIGEDGSEIVTNPYNLLKWLGWDPFEINECRDCKVLPLCMGGCSHKIRNSDMDIERGCLRLRFSMDQIIEVFGESMSGNSRGALSGSCGCTATAMPNL